jgi:pyruvate/2-oxoglutarate/acetoin dehydrogenase E1 component
MAWVSLQPNSIFIGQGVGCAGTTMTDSLRDVPKDKLLEFPVAEDLQMGTAIGMALEGLLPVCIFPRWNFLVCATNQIVNHLDRLPIYSNGGYNPRVIIRVATPITAGFYPGPQHDDDFTDAFRKMLRKIEVVRLDTAGSIMPEYQRAVEGRHSTLLVEYTALYGAVPSGVKG